MESLYYESIKFYSTGPNVIDLFMSVIYKCSYQARALVPGKTFQPSLMFVGKAKSLPKRGASFKCSTWEVSGWKGLPEANTLAYYKNS